MARPTLGPYTLLRRVGSGGMGEVWIARREAIGGAAKLVALKTVLPEKAGNAESRRMFLDEARLAMLMSNSNIVQVFDVGETRDGICYMAMEYVEGLDLAKLTEALRIRGEKLSHPVIGYIISEVLKALAYAHDHSIEGARQTVVHRDISPQNVMLSVSGEVKVTDFGIARLASEETSGSFVRGKFRYMPPEQFERGLRTPTLDLFAVGALLHELLDGKRFRGSEVEETEMIGMCVQGFVPKLSCPPPPPVFERLRLGLLEADAGKRIQTAREAHRLLSQWPGNRDCKFELEDIVRSVADDPSLPSHLLTATGSGRSANSDQGVPYPPAPKPAPPPASAPPPAAVGAVSRSAAPAAASRYAGAASRSRAGAPPKPPPSKPRSAAPPSPRPSSPPPSPPPKTAAQAEQTSSSSRSATWLPGAAPEPPGPPASRKKQTMLFGARQDMAPLVAPRTPPPGPPPSTAAPMSQQTEAVGAAELREVVAEHRAEASMRSLSESADTDSIPRSGRSAANQDATDSHNREVSNTHALPAESAP
ncbi:MAG: serine/threonine protein kinase, partial [Myxococcales bacterium]|nr:serine/threonine protein kinase [Myxococcales bacterium]